MEHGGYPAEQPAHPGPEPAKKAGLLSKLFSSFRRPKKPKHARSASSRDSQMEGSGMAPVQGSRLQSEADGQDTFQRPGERAEHWQSNPQLFHGGDTLDPAAGSGKPTQKSKKSTAVRSLPVGVARVILLDGEEQEFTVEKKATGHDLMTRVCEHLELEEIDYFGMTYVDSKERMWFWLDPEKKLAKQVKREYFLS